MLWLVHNNVKRKGTHHTCSLSLPKHRSAAWEGDCTTAIWSSDFLGWVETTHFSASSHFTAVSHIPCYLYMLLFKGLLSYFFCCFIHVRFYSYFICGSFNISSTNLCSTDKNCFAYFYLESFAYSSYFFFLLFCHLSPSPGMQPLDAQILHLWWRDLSNTPLLEEKRRGRVWGVSQCARCRSYEMASTDLRLHDSND